MSDEQKGVSILDEAPAPEMPADENDPNVILGKILESLSGLQLVVDMFNARMEQMERLVGYLLQKDPDFMANMQKMEAEAKAAEAAAASQNGTPET